MRIWIQARQQTFTPGENPRSSKLCPPKAMPAGSSPCRGFRRQAKSICSILPPRREGRNHGATSHLSFPKAKCRRSRTAKLHIPSSSEHAGTIHWPAKMTAPFPIPSGLHPSAQGCEARGTLGNRPRLFPQPQRGCITVSPPGCCNPVGVDDILPGSPRVASRTWRSWAGGRYPVGVDQLAESRQLVTNCHLLKAGCRSVSQLVTYCNQLKTACVFIAQPVTNCYRLKPPTTP